MSKVQYQFIKLIILKSKNRFVTKNTTPKISKIKYYCFKQNKERGSHKRKTFEFIQKKLSKYYLEGLLA